jgi:hypothetical protein
VTRTISDNLVLNRNSLERVGHSCGASRGHVSDTHKAIITGYQEMKRITSAIVVAAFGTVADSDSASIIDIPAQFQGNGVTALTSHRAMTKCFLSIGMMAALLSTVVPARAYELSSACREYLDVKQACMQQTAKNMELQGNLQGASELRRQIPYSINTALYNISRSLNKSGEDIRCKASVAEIRNGSYPRGYELCSENSGHYPKNYRMQEVQ